MSCVHVCVLTSSYMNWRVRADFPTPPLPTMMTLWRAREFWPLGFAVAMVLLTKRSEAGDRKCADQLGEDEDLKPVRLSQMLQVQ